MWMDRSSQVERWNHTAQILCMLHNNNCNETKHLKQPWQFHRYGSEVKPKPRRMSIEHLKVFVENRHLFVKPSKA